MNSTLDLPDLTPGDGVVNTANPGEVTLRAAMMEADALQGYGVIRLPSGTYDLNSPLTITSHAAIEGDSAATTEIRATGSTVCLR